MINTVQSTISYTPSVESNSSKQSVPLFSLKQFSKPQPPETAWEKKQVQIITNAAHDIINLRSQKLAEIELKQNKEGLI